MMTLVQGPIRPGAGGHTPGRIYRKTWGSPVKRSGLFDKPDAYLRELALPYGCSVVAVCKALKKHHITYKKNLRLP
jgi:hypothetical protein